MHFLYMTLRITQYFHRCFSTNGYKICWVQLWDELFCNGCDIFPSSDMDARSFHFPNFINILDISIKKPYSVSIYKSAVMDFIVILCVKCSLWIWCYEDYKRIWWYLLRDFWYQGHEAINNLWPEVDFFIPCDAQFTALWQENVRSSCPMIYVVICNMSSTLTYSCFCLWSASNKCHYFVLFRCRCHAMTVISMLIHYFVILSHAMLHVLPSLAAIS